MYAIAPLRIYNNGRYITRPIPQPASPIRRTACTRTTVPHRTGRPQCRTDTEERRVSKPHARTRGRRAASHAATPRRPISVGAVCPHEPTKQNMTGQRPEARRAACTLPCKRNTCIHPFLFPCWTARIACGVDVSPANPPPRWRGRRSCWLGWRERHGERTGRPRSVLDLVRDLEG